MRIAEIFRSFQGEGRLTGAESVFVRASGCNLRCRYCDTPYASWVPEGEDLSVDEIVARVEQLDRQPPPARPPGAVQPAGRAATVHGGRVAHAVLTGGEPMLFAELVPLAAELHRQGRHVTIETAGTLLLPVVCDLMSISPKLSNSTPAAAGDPRWTWRHESTRAAREVVRRLTADYDYQLKFVVADLADCREVEAYLANLPEIDRGRAMLMPQGTDAELLAEAGRWLEPYCRAHGLAFCPRRQIEWFGAGRST
jgi:7-carboxy-7-deazaguanine synthase